MSNRKFRDPLSLLLILLSFIGSGEIQEALSAPPGLLELQGAEHVYRGKLVALDDNLCWLMGPDGRLDRIELSQVKSVNRVANRFEPATPASVRAQLQKEFGPQFEVSGTTHYLICAPRGEGSEYGKVLEEVYRGYITYFAKRGFRVEQPEYPLVAVILPDRNTFAKYAAKDGLQAFPGLMGYYLRTSNRVALYDTSNEIITRKPGQQVSELIVPNGPHLAGNLQGQSVRGTLIHEATHQLAYNTGLHSRIGVSPKWVVEGLATVFEADGIRQPGPRDSIKTRLNPQRHEWFDKYRGERRPEKSLALFLAEDRLFDQQALDAYSQAWALTFFLVETRPAQYADYLRIISQRDPLKDYPAKDRLADFQAAFGKDLAWIEVEFLRFMDRLD